MLIQLLIKGLIFLIRLKLYIFENRILNRQNAQQLIAAANKAIIMTEFLFCVIICCCRWLEMDNRVYITTIRI